MAKHRPICIGQVHEPVTSLASDTTNRVQRSIRTRPGTCAARHCRELGRGVRASLSEQTSSRHVAKQGLVVTQMAKVKKEHYVSRFYLRRFTTDGSHLYVYDKSTGKSF